MLKLKVKPTGNLDLQEIQCYSVYVSPDLSYISGRTSYYNSIINGENVVVVNNTNKFKNACVINSENVKVQGDVKLEIKLPIQEISKYYFSDKEVKLISGSCKYVEYNNVYSYEYEGVYVVDGKMYSADADGESVTITTFAYIEDGVVKIGDKEYIADFRSGGKPDIRESKYAEPLNEGDKITDSITFKGVLRYTPEEWRRETKFSITKQENDELAVEDVLFGGYEHYIEYDGETYYFKNSESNGEYGVYINENFYSGYSMQIYDDMDEKEYPKDDIFYGGVIKIDDSIYSIQNSLISPVNGGKFVFIITKSERLELREGTTIIARSNGPISSKINIVSDTDESGNVISSYITYIDKRYDVKENAYSAVSISDKEYRLIETIDGEYYAQINSNRIYFDIEGEKAIPTNNIYYFDEGIKYGKYSKGHDITLYSGVTIGDNVYKVQEEESDYVYGLINYYVEIIEDATYNLVVRELNGSKTYICYPNIDNNEIYSASEIDAISRHVSNLVVNNKDNFTFYVRNDIFGGEPIYPYTCFFDVLGSAKPITSADKLNISIYKVNSYLNVRIPIIETPSNDLTREDIIGKYFSETEKDKKRSTAVDMEKDIYYPVWLDENSRYNPVVNLRFNMHFRTRQLDNWKIIEDYTEDDGNESFNNWFITDYKYYKEAIQNEQSSLGVSHTIHNASDLLGYMNFTTSEIRNRAKKIGKSFLRLSFYSTDNPQTQTLLGTSTIFLDDAYLAKKIYSFQKSSNVGSFIKTQAYEINSSNEAFYKTNSITADSELEGGDYNFSATTTSRLSSCINVYDKQLTNCSSEGFYFYMFREFSNNMRPMTIYLRIDFNHAGIGKTIPMMLPRKNIETDGVGKPLYIHKRNDLEILKEGFALKDIYKQLYIPINVIYDENTSRYVYYLPDKLRENSELGVSNDVMEFNLFEVKFKDESKYEGNQ